MNKSKAKFSILLSSLLFFNLIAQAKIIPLSGEACANMVANNTYTNKNSLSCQRLQLVTFPYVDFNGVIHRDGKVMVLDALAPEVEKIFFILFKQGFPLQQTVLMEHYQGNDRAAMADNNTSAFNGRYTTEDNTWSMHAYGAAIDVNPMQNPFVDFSDLTTITVEPKASAKVYLNRLDARPNKPVRKGMVEPIIDIFAYHGFIVWGGYWNFPIDYQHFEIGSREFAQQLSALPAAQARQVFSAYVGRYRVCMAQTTITPHAAARAACVAKVQR